VKRLELTPFIEFMLEVILDTVRKVGNGVGNRVGNNLFCFLGCWFILNPIQIRTAKEEFYFLYHLEGEKSLFSSPDPWG